MKRLVLLGGGHAHLAVLKDLARQGLPGTEVILVTPHPRTLYSGMIPGLVAGHYSAEQCAIDTEALARAARVAVRHTVATGLDADARIVQLAEGGPLAYDWLSLDTGPVIDRDAIAGAREHALFVRPIEHFVTLWQQVVELAGARPLRVAVIGGGAGGVELAMAVKWRLKDRAHVDLVTGGVPPVATHPAAVQARVRKALLTLGVALLEERCTGIEAGRVLLANGAALACDAPIVAIGTAPPPWLADSRLQLKEGFVATNPDLRSASHPNVFAAGDVASRVDIEHPKSGVYAVRAGPPLAENIRLAVGMQPGRPYMPPERTLNLISCGRKRAIAARGDWSAEGAWVWFWKNWIDTRFVRRARA